MGSVPNGCSQDGGDSPAHVHRTDVSPLEVAQGGPNLTVLLSVEGPGSRGPRESG